MQENHVYEMELGGRNLTIETGRYAFQADGAVVVRCGGTAVLVTATASKNQREGIDFFPLSVEFEEKLYSVGKIPGGYIKREGRPSEKAVLAARLIDRPIRPLFPKGYRNDVQVVATVLSVEPDIPPEVYAMIGSSAALAISGIPFAGPTGSVNVGLVDGKFVINPDSAQRERSRLDLTVAGTKDAVMMVEAGADEVTEEEMLAAILYAHEEIKRICAFIEDIKEDVGAPPKEVTIYQIPDEIDAAVREYAGERVRWSVDTFDRDEREARQQQVKTEVSAHFAEQFPGHEEDFSGVLYNMTKEVIRDRIVNEGVRPDGRSYEEIRPIWADTGLVERAHGSAVFTRGLTQVMNFVTLGGLREGQSLDGISEDTFKRYMHHYNMPPYSTGEAKMMRSTSRREIGHGALAGRALEPVLPSEDEFPYAIRSVSEVVSSNGSTSQASVCSSCLALMDAGVPIKAPVAGCAMGLMKQDDKVVVLTDIQGLEDFLGDMDFKVAGTDRGITAIQMDIKIKGIDREILERALEQARKGRLFILGKMNEVLSAPRPELSPYAPKIVQFFIDPDKIREVIGSGGKVINKIIDETGVKIDIEDDGRVQILTSDLEAAEKARRIIESIVKDIAVGDVFLGKVTRIMNIGVFVELAPGKEGMCRISNLSNSYINQIEDVVSIGDELLVRVTDIDKQGRINLTHKGLVPEKRGSSGGGRGGRGGQQRRERRERQPRPVK
ncbi:MAG: polyribonucleotide nucleotidyltransferase [Clostridia bacterium]|nr:polyribonucleotide nucleotidyltransferase [Clostridia bacterium]